ncbi:hypothetical protein AVEN_223124-1 [Araneus ventricosus]|uniref:RNase H type-1 domain-containing protein n=1 Tax=Araneus ventricosus TaxID=182803 RepID=A0A4Y2E9Z0_ARAVE|nr:hypothetical protein AVEN_223124-1 [Araneus ventricosus]
MYFYGSARKSLLQTLETIHHQGFRLSSGAFRTSSVQSLYIISKEPAFELRRHKLALKYYFKIKSNNEHPMYDKILQPAFGTFYADKKSYIASFGHRMRSVLQTFNTQNVDIVPKLDELLPRRDFDIRIIDEFYKLLKSSTSDNVYWQLFYNHKQQHNSAFTDGSETANHVGSAVVFNNFTVTEELHEYYTVFTAEIYAILLALNVTGTSQDKKKMDYLYRF